MKIKLARESRGALPGDSPLYLMEEGGAAILSLNNETSILRGDLKNWVLAHLVDKGETTGKLEPSINGGVITTEEGEIITLEGWPLREGKPEAQVPVPDLPRPPTTLEDWRAAIAAAAPFSDPGLMAVSENETPSAYAARVLAPMGLTLAAVLAGRALGPDQLRHATGPEWDTILTAAGIQREAPAPAAALAETSPQPPAA